MMPMPQKKLDRLCISLQSGSLKVTLIHHTQDDADVLARYTSEFDANLHLLIAKQWCHVDCHLKVVHQPAASDAQ